MTMNDEMIGYIYRHWSDTRNRRNILELLQLRYFQTVAKLESITLAAEHHLVPQSSMSQTIRRLENDLGGIKLFDRKNGRIYLNQQGRTFLNYVDATLASLEGGIRAVSSATDEIEGVVRLKVMENHRLVLTCVPAFLKMYPKVRFTISHGYHEEKDADYDLCISSETSFRQLNEKKLLLEERLILAVHEDHPLAKAKTVRITDLRGENLISMPSQSALSRLVSTRCRALGFEPEMPVICDDPYFVRKYVSDDLGIAVTPEISWKGRFRENTKLIPFEEEDMRVRSYILWNGKGYMTPAAKTFIEYLIEEAQKLY